MSNTRYLSHYLENLVPTVTAPTPSSGAVGASVTITGTNFFAVQGSGTVTFNGTPAVVTSWSDTSIVVTVPVGATTGNLVVTNSWGNASSGWAFTINAVTVGGLSPSLGAPPIGAGACLVYPPVRG